VESLTSNYGMLTPPPLGFCFWSVANLDEGYLRAIDLLPCASATKTGH
jgi:hypothetical protein